MKGWRDTAASQLLDFVLDLQFLAFQFDDFQIIRSRMMSFRLYLSFERFVAAFEFGEMVRH